MTLESLRRLIAGVLLSVALDAGVAAADVAGTAPDASAAPGGTEMGGPEVGGPEVQGPGFAFRAPQGDGWVELSPQILQRLDPAYRIGYARAVGSDHRALIGLGSMILTPSAESPEDVLKAIAQSRRSTGVDVLGAGPAGGGARASVISTAAAMTTRGGASCWREDEAAEDRGVPGHEGDVFLLTHHRLLCLHPDFAGLLIIADVSLRLGPGQAAAAGDEAGEAVFQSLTFPSFGRHVTAIPLGRSVHGLAASPGAIWATVGHDDGGVARIDPASNRVIITVPTGRWPVGVAADAAGVWVANTGDDTVSRIDPATDRVVATIRVGHRPLQVALGAGAVWVSNSGDGSVSRIDPATNAASPLAGIAAMPSGIAVAGQVVLVADYDGDRIARIDAGTGGILDRLPAGQRSSMILTTGDEVWTNDPGDRAVLRLYPGESSRPPDKISAGIGVEPAGLARDGSELWVANSAEGLLAIVDLRDPSRPARAIPVGRRPLALLAAEGAIWAADAEGGTVLRLDAR